jgi:pyridoxamine 5'-phosphate oxidase
VSLPPDDEPLLERDLDPDPIAQFRAWLDQAKAAGIRYPEAMALATSDPDGRPSVRHVLMRGLDERGLVFFTNYGSRKARQIEQNASGAAVFLWRELDRQVSLTGPIERTSAQESEAYFRTRPREARLGAWASRQSEVVGSREVLEQRYARMERRFAGREVPLPQHWGGYRLQPATVEFWKGRRHRLHDRFRYRRSGTGWLIERLYP